MRRMILNTAKRVLRLLPGLGPLLDARDVVRRIQPGHFYSPIPELREVVAHESRIFDRALRPLGGIDLRAAAQLELLEELAAFYGELPFRDVPTEGLRYCFQNSYYSYADAIFLYGMLRRYRPRRVVEIGCGWSTCAILDTRERFLDDTTHVTSIDPDPSRFCERLKPGDEQRIRLIADRLQQVDIRLFDELGSGDFLIVDSSHVVKVDSDVNHIVFDILPRLSQGVFVHFHDMFYPFEYPRDWIQQGRYWSEAYLVRAFLQFNRDFEIVAWNHFLGLFHRQRLAERMPLCLENIGGSLWIRRYRGPSA